MPNWLRDPADVIGEARRWVGTPFRHQWARAGRGCDCVGLVRGVAENLGLIEIPADMRRDLDTYSRTPDPARMGTMLEHFLTRSDLNPRGEAPDGYVAWLQWRDDLPMHLAITSTARSRRTVIHALREVGVAEHGFTGIWRGRVHSYWRLPHVAYP